MGRRVRLALGPGLLLALLWLAHNELFHVCARQRLVEQVLGGGADARLGQVFTVIGFVVARLLLYLLGPGLALVAATYLVRRPVGGPATEGTEVTGAAVGWEASAVAPTRDDR